MKSVCKLGEKREREKERGEREREGRERERETERECDYELKLMSVSLPNLFALFTSLNKMISRSHIFIVLGYF